jgi:small subunit ribosomal protein S17
MKQLQGTVISLKNAKTAQVSVVRQWQHPLYKKLVKRTKKIACHFENLELQLGDEVMVKSCRPISKLKRFEITQKVEVKA